MASKYTVLLADGLVTVVDERNQPVPPAVYEALSRLLHHGYRAELDRQYLLEMERLLAESQWRWPALSDRERPFDGATNCVYFVEFGAMPGSIKIGSAKRLSVRMHELRREHGPSGFRVLAVATLEDFRLLERVLHAYFRAYQVRGKKDWFQAEPVVLWVSMQRPDAQ